MIKLFGGEIHQWKIEIFGMVEQLVVHLIVDQAVVDSSPSPSSFRKLV